MKKKTEADKKVNITRYYEFSWGTWPNIESVTTDYMSLASLMFDSINYGIHGTKVDHPILRFLNVIVIQRFLVMGNLGSIKHELGHFGHMKAYGYKPSINLTFSVPFLEGRVTIHRQFYAKNSEDFGLVAFGNGMGIDSYNTYEALKELYSGRKTPAYYGMMSFSNRLMNFILVYSNYRYVKNPWGNNIKKIYSGKDPLSYTFLLTQKYGYYDSILPVWSYMPFVKKLSFLYMPTNPYLAINHFFRDQYKRMIQAYVIELVDPSFLSFFYGMFQYIRHGVFSSCPVMIPIKNVRFMPSFRASLGNFGSENYFDLFFIIKDLLHFSVYYRYGGNLYDKIHGFGIDVRDIKTIDQIKLSFQFDYWTLVEGSQVDKNREYLFYNNLQPITGLGYFRKHYNNKNCFNVFMKINWHCYKNLHIVGSIGYKTYGALMGKQLEKGVYGNGGLGFDLDFKI